MNNTSFKSIYINLIYGKGNIKKSIIEMIERCEFENFSLFNGLIGFGWILEYCYFHRLISYDINRLIEDVDDLLYQRVLHIRRSNSFVSEEMFNLLLYYHRRTLNGRYYDNTARNHSILPCLRLVIYRIDEYLLSIHGSQINSDLYLSLIVLKYSAMSRNFQSGNFGAAVIDNSEKYLSYIDKKLELTEEDLVAFFLRLLSFKYVSDYPLLKRYNSIYKNKIRQYLNTDKQSVTESTIQVLNRLYFNEGSIEPLFSSYKGDFTPVNIPVFVILLDIMKELKKN